MSLDVACTHTLLFGVGGHRFIRHCFSLLHRSFQVPRGPSFLFLLFLPVLSSLSSDPVVTADSPSCSETYLGPRGD